MRSEVTTTTATIANGAATTEAIDVRFRDVVGVVIPSAWTAAGIGFNVSYDSGTTYVPVKRPEVGTATAPIPSKTLEILSTDVPTSTATFMGLRPEWFHGATHLKVLSQTNGSAVNQGAARSVILVMRQSA